MRVCAALLLPLVALSDCAMPLSTPDWLAEDVAGPEPTNYRIIVAKGLGGIIGGKDNLQTRVLEISAPRRVDATKGAAWLVCVKYLRVPSRLPRAYYTVFIQADKIVESRLSVGVDQCETQVYSPFEWNVDANIPLLPR